ncbi:MAG: hypothetical protein RBR78_11190 [Flavobacteriaceae bacterium]|jgi:hypothetical protein|nr:hypothetical protein [Flavobacteriaceae bacterium]
MKYFKLDNYPKISSGFKTPDGYFDNLEKEILQKTENAQKPIVRSLYFKRAIFGMVAIMLLLVGMTFLYNSKRNLPDVDQIENYLSQNMDTYDMMVLMEDSDLNNFSIDLKLDSEIIENQINNDYYIDFLLNE